MEEPTEKSPGLFASLKRLGTTLLAIAQNRLELLLVEWEEERRRVVEALLLIMAAAVGALVTLMMVTFTLVVVFWEEHRVAVVLTLSLLYGVITILICLRLRRRLQNWPAFSDTLAEFKKDKACLDEKK